jgi:hypothetical protein
VGAELERAQRACNAAGDSEHWRAAVAMNEAITAYWSSDRGLYLAAREVGIAEAQWFALKTAADVRRPFRERTC